jgi:membrane protein DedA with SNARE-associated domain
MGQWVLDLVRSGGYPGIVFLMFTENVFPPIPSEAIMPLAGFLAAQGKLSLIGAVLAGTLGSVLGALPLYYLGRAVGEERVERLAARYGRWLTVSPGEVRKAKAWFDRHGPKAVFFCRLVPVVRSLISIPAGINHMPLGTFLLYTGLGTGLWSLLLAGGGYLLRDNFDRIGAYLDPITWIVLAAVLLAYIVRVIRQARRQRCAQRRL